MRLSKHKRRSLPLMNMTPMIDVVFLLLIFFMTVSQVSKLNRENVDLPRLKGAEDQRPTILTINVTQEGRTIVSGNPLSTARLAAMSWPSWATTPTS
jgi:biopolymer transport protein ExbD